MGTFLIGIGIYFLITILACWGLINLCFKYEKEEFAFLVYPTWLILTVIAIGIYLNCQ